MPEVCEIQWCQRCRRKGLPKDIGDQVRDRRAQSAGGDAAELAESNRDGISGHECWDGEINFPRGFSLARLAIRAARAPFVYGAGHRHKRRAYRAAARSDPARAIKTKTFFRKTRRFGRRRWLLGPRAERWHLRYSRAVTTRTNSVQIVPPYRTPVRNSTAEVTASVCRSIRWIRLSMAFRITTFRRESGQPRTTSRRYLRKAISSFMPGSVARGVPACDLPVHQHHPKPSLVINHPCEPLGRILQRKLLYHGPNAGQRAEAQHIFGVL
jgi:hypothetical protein